MRSHSLWKSMPAACLLFQFYLSVSGAAASQNATVNSTQWNTQLQRLPSSQSPAEGSQGIALPNSASDGYVNALVRAMAPNYPSPEGNVSGRRFTDPVQDITQFLSNDVPGWYKPGATLPPQGQDDRIVITALEGRPSSARRTVESERQLTFYSDARHQFQIQLLQNVFVPYQADFFLRVWVYADKNQSKSSESLRNRTETTAGLVMTTIHQSAKLQRNAQGHSTNPIAWPNNAGKYLRLASEFKLDPSFKDPNLERGFIDIYVRTNLNSLRGVTVLLRSLLKDLLNLPTPQRWEKYMNAVHELSRNSISGYVVLPSSPERPRNNHLNSCLALF